MIIKAVTLVGNLDPAFPRWLGGGRRSRDPGGIDGPERALNRPGSCSPPREGTVVDMDPVPV